MLLSPITDSVLRSSLLYLSHCRHALAFQKQMVGLSDIAYLPQEEDADR